MKTRHVTRRELLQTASATLAGLAMLRFAVPAEAFPARPGETTVPWWDPPPPNPVPEAIGQQLDWERLDSWITPTDKHFWIAHYGRPQIAESDWRLEIGGLVRQPLTLTLADVRARPRQEVTFTLECAGNHGFPFFTGGIGTGRWTGTPLAPLLQEAGLLDRARDVVFWGIDTGLEKVRDVEVTEQFARSMGPADALAPDNLLAYELNGEPLPRSNGFPLRLIAPGWYGVANVKWLRRIEVRDAPYEGRFMGRDYVTMREEQRDGKPIVVFTSVGRARLKSAPARVSVRDGLHRIVGAAWGAPIARVEVRIDDGPWRGATLEEGQGAPHAWTFWYLDWPNAATGEHTITSRAIDTAGNVQPAPADPVIANKKTYWESNGQITRRIGIGIARPMASGHLGPLTTAVHRFAYPGNEAVYAVNLQVAPDLPEVVARAGFRVYTPSGALQATGGAQHGLRPNVAGNLISRQPGDYAVQVYNDQRNVPINYQLTVLPGPPEGR